jgi:pimeloyl-ACP methyl ester carboxylesterase
MHAQRLNISVKLAVAVGIVWTLAGSPAAYAQTPTKSDNAAAPYRDGTIKVDGRTIHYLDWGPEGKPAFILVHALGHSAHNYDHVAPLLNQRHRVIAIDLRGHGDSDWSPKGEYSVEDYVSDLHGLVTQLKLGPVTLIGCSIGGRVVQVYSGMYPDRVSKLIVLDVGPARPESTTRTLSGRIEREQQGWASEEELYASLRRNPTRVPEEVHRNQVRYESKRLANGRVVWKYDPKVVNGLGPIELWDYVKKIKAPTLYVIGGRSRLVTPEEQRQLKTLPFAEVITIPEAGHYPQEDTPELFLAVVKAFLAG